MKKQKAEKINLPYASTVASYFSDQGGGPGNSFLGGFARKPGAGGSAGSMVSNNVKPGYSIPSRPGRPGLIGVRG